MEIAQILEDLAYDMGELPREAIESAIVKRRQITPFLLEILADAIARVDVIIEDDSYQGHLYAMYLLAQFREKKAFPLLLKLFSFPGEIPYAIAGDVITEDLSRILASICDDDITPLKAVIENPAANEYVRAACQTTLVTLVGCGNGSRNEVIDYFKSLFNGGLERIPSFAWDNLVAASCALYPDSLFSEICRAYEDQLIDTSFITLDHVSSILAGDKHQHIFKLFQNSELIDDTVTEMEKWLSGHYFQ